jgi:hypothetical protein
MSPISVEVDCSHLPPVVDVLSPPCKSCSICRKANRRSFPVICPTGDEKTAIGTSVGFHLPRRTRPSHVCSAARNARNASGNLAQALRLGLRPEGPWELSPGFSLGRLHPHGSPVGASDQGVMDREGVLEIPAKQIAECPARK